MYLGADDLRLISRIGSLLLLSFVPARAEGVFVKKSFSEACSQAEREKKIVFVDFYTTWCAPCTILDQSTFKDESVIRWLQDQTIPLKVDAEKETKLAEQFRVSNFPTLLFVRPDGTELDRLGFVNAKEFLTAAPEILTSKDPLARAQSKLESAGKNDPLARMEYARRLAQSGKNEEALSEYLWCYDEGGKANPAFVGVRNSFFLTELAALGSRYAPALEAMRQRRNTLRTLIARNQASRADVTDYAALNDALRETDDSVKLYDQLRAEHPDWMDVKYLQELILDPLLDAHRYAEIADASDIDERIELGLARLKMLPPDIPKEQRAQIESYMLKSLIVDMAKHYEVLTGLKRTDTAAQLAERALKLDDGAATHNALAWHGLKSGYPSETHVVQAQKAYELTGGKDAAVVDTLARLLAAMGRENEACEVVQKCIASIDKEADRYIMEACSRELNCTSTP